MNAKVRCFFAPKISLQQFIQHSIATTPRLVVDQTTPPSTYQPNYVAHRPVTFGRKAGAK